MSKNHYTYLSRTWNKCLNSVNLWNWEDLKRKKDYKRLCPTLHTIQSMLVHKNASSCRKMSKKMIRRFYDIIEWVLYLSQVCRPSKFSFFWKLIIEHYFKSLANKSNSHECPFLHFFQHDPKGVRVLTNLIVFSFGLAYQKSFNSAWNNIFLHFCAAIMDLFIILKCKDFVLLITLQQELTPVIDHLGWKCTSNKIKL